MNKEFKRGQISVQLNESILTSFETFCQQVADLAEAANYKAFNVTVLLQDGTALSAIDMSNDEDALTMIDSNRQATLDMIAQRPQS